MCVLCCFFFFGGGGESIMVYGIMVYGIITYLCRKHHSRLNIVQVLIFEKIQQTSQNL